MIKSDINIKEKFSKMCELIFINSSGKFVFPFENLEYDIDWMEFTSHADYNILKSKMNNLIKLTNEDLSILNLDVEEEIWEMV